VPYELLDEILATAGQAPAKGAVEFVGSDPVLPTPYRIGDAGAAAIGASALAAARLWESRGGESQAIRVPVDASAIAMRSARYIAAEPPTPQPTTGMRSTGFYQARDGRWMYFQRLFAHHLARQLEVLGCEESDEAIAKSVAQWDGRELEDAIVANGATGAFVRHHDEWAAHDQAKALSLLPLFEITKIGESPAEPLPPSPRPLSGVRVLDLTRVLAGPTCARTLSEHGAEVLRVGTNAFPDNEMMMRDTGHGKRSCELDLKTAAGAETLRALIPSADVFSQGYRPGALDRLGLSPDEVAARRPGIVYMTISAFSHEGPWRDRRGFDSVVQAASGIADEVSDPVTGRPRSLPANPLDYQTGYLAAFATVVALMRRAAEGGSYLVRLSLAQTGHWLKGVSRADPALVATRPPELPPDRIEELSMVRNTPYGRLRYFAPVAQMSRTPALWDLPTVPLDHDPPAWR
jgi:crotonobetainyl-CoA:carnitine CoA-transferase CaiB-like acyl-CoA transferase